MRARRRVASAALAAMVLATALAAPSYAYDGSPGSASCSSANLQLSVTSSLFNNLTHPTYVQWDLAFFDVDRGVWEAINGSIVYSSVFYPWLTLSPTAHSYQSSTLQFTMDYAHHYRVSTRYFLYDLTTKQWLPGPWNSWTWIGSYWYKNLYSNWSYVPVPNNSCPVGSPYNM